MTTRNEKLESIRHVVEAAKKRLAVLDMKKKDKTMTRSEIFEREMILELILRGEQLILNSSPGDFV